jgi:aspartate/methionine/tyrosine aminotransferase
VDTGAQPFGILHYSRRHRTQWSGNALLSFIDFSFFTVFLSMQFSDRIAHVQSPIIPTIAALVRDNPGTISLGQGVVNYGPPVHPRDALASMSVAAGDHKYQSVSGYAPLVKALWEKLQHEGGFQREGAQLMVTAGSNMAFLNALIVVADPGDEIILPAPYYFNQEMAIRMVGAQPVLVPTKANYQLDLVALEQAITKRTRAIVTVSPNNPTGAVYSPEDLAAVNRLCQARGIYHFADEAYEYFLHGAARHFSPASLPGANAHTLSFYSFSKAWGMASWRVGYIVYPDHLHEAMCKVQDTNLICAPLASQWLATAALAQGRSVLTGHLQSLSAVREQVYQALDAVADVVQYPKTEGAFYVLVRLPGLPNEQAVLEFNQRMAREFKVATIPGFAFGLNDTAAGNYQRLSYGALEPASVVEGVDRFVQAVKTCCR